MGRRWTFEQAFDQHVPERPEGECWPWTGPLHKAGYGRICAEGKQVLAHRWSFEHFRGPVPDGLVLDHLVCSNPPCCNPWHLEPVTIPENVQREWQATGKCRAGLHEVTPDENGRWRCSACHNAARRRRRAKKAASPE